MKILFLVSTLKRCGPVSVLKNILKYLDQSRYQALILTLSPEPERSLWPEIEELGARIFTLGLNRLEGFLSGPKLLKETLEQLQPDILHSHGWRADLFAQAFIGRIPWISTLHNRPQEDYILSYGKLIGGIFSRSHLNIISRMDHPVACSRSICRLLLEWNPGIVYVQNGVDNTEFAPPDEREKQSLRDKLGFPSDRPVFISTGSLTELKDPITVISAFNKVSHRRKATLVLLGMGPLFKECRKHMDGSGSVLLKGRVSNVNEYLKASDFFISASHTEGMPNSVLEALSTGLPVVLSDIEAHREILEYDFLAGETFNMGNPESLSQKIDRLIDDDREERSRAARGIIDNHLSAINMSGKYCEIYRSLCKIY